MVKIILISIVSILVLYNIYPLLFISTHVFSVFLLVVYIINHIFYIKYIKNDFLSPSNFILIIFYFITFLYFPLLDRTEVDNLRLNQTINGIGYDHMVYCQVISVISILLFMVGTLLKPIRLFANKNISMVKGRRIFIHFATFILIIFALANGLLDILRRYQNDSDVGLSGAGFYLSFITVFMTISTVLEFNKLKSIGVITLRKTFMNVSYLYLFNVLFMSSVYFLAGYRSALFPLVLPILYLYNTQIYKIKTRYLILGTILGILVMSQVRESRGGNNGGLEQISLLSMFYDFVSANTGLYYLVDRTIQEGSEWGTNAFYQIISFVPFLQNFVKGIFNVESSLSSSNVYMTETGWEYGLGTNVIGDLYYSFDIFGPLIILFIFGWLVKSLHFNSQKNLLAQIFYMLILGHSIMFCRIEFFSIVRYLGLAYFTYISLKIFVKE